MYNPQDWYWLADDGRIFASAREIIVTSTDADYVTWSNNNTASGWPRDDAGNQTNASLQEVLAPYNLFVDLIYYAADARWRRQTGGVTVAGVTYRSDRTSENERMNAYTYAKSGIVPSVIFQWKLPDGTFVTLDEAQLENVAISESQFVQTCFTCEKDTVASITGGSITTRAEVDAAFAAIANVFP